MMSLEFASGYFYIPCLPGIEERCRLLPAAIQTNFRILP
jgi:hypothetical protein